MSTCAKAHAFLLDCQLPDRPLSGLGNSRMDRIVLREAPVPVTPPNGLVYSTNPQVAAGEDGQDYFLKGPNTQIAFAELASYELANLVGLAVPPHAVCLYEGELYFGSRGMWQRQVPDDWLRAPDRIVNPGIVADTIAFDVWIANPDRNIGGFVGEPISQRESPLLRVLAIDFEKSHVLRGTPSVQLTTIAPNLCKPHGLLAGICSELSFPEGFCRRIAAVDEDKIADCIRQSIMAMNMPSIDWTEGSIRILTKRSRNIRPLVKEAWDA